jgi:hypothetical protein
MRLFANLLKRVPAREVAPILVAVLALAGILGHAAPIFRGILELVGSYWG